DMREEWVATGNIPGDAEQFKPEQHLAFMLKNNKIVDTYEYRTINNRLLGYGVRFEDKETAKKQVLPVTYCYNEAKEQYAWRLKGFSDLGYKPIYGAEKLHQEIKPVLIVE